MEVAELSVGIRADLSDLIRGIRTAPNVAAAGMREAVRQAERALLVEQQQAGRLALEDKRAAGRQALEAQRQTNRLAVEAARQKTQALRAEAQQAASGMVGAFSGVGERIRGLLSGIAISGLGQSLQQSVTVPLMNIGRTAIMAAADYEQSFNVFKASNSATEAQMRAVGAEAVKLGADLSLPGTSANDAMKAMLALSQAGLSVKDSMGAAHGVLLLSAAAQISNKEAAEITANALNSFGLAGRQAGNVADILANSSLNSGKSAQDMGNAIQQGGAVAKLAGQSLGDFMTAVTLMGRAGIAGSDAGTSLKTMFQRLMAPTNEAAGVMRQFGIQTRDASGNMLPLPKIVDEFSTKLRVGAPFVTAYGGSVKAMDKALKEAEAAAKTAQRTLETMPNTLRLQTLQLADLQRKLADVNKPERDLTETIRHQESQLASLTREMAKHTEDGLRKLGRESADAKGRIAETTLELDIQRAKLKELQTAMKTAPPEMKANKYGVLEIDQTAMKEKQLEIVRLQNTIRESEANLGDWKREIADADRQMKEGLDGDKQKAEQIRHLGVELDANKKKLQDWQKSGREQATLELKAQIDGLTTSMEQNRQKVTEAEGVMRRLDVARTNATRVVRTMTAADRDAALGTIFGSDAIRAATIVLGGGRAAFETMSVAVNKHGTTARIAAAQTSGLKGALDGLKSTVETLYIQLGTRLLPALTDFVKRGAELIGSIGQLPARTIALGGAFLGVAAAAGPVLRIIGGIGVAVSTLGGPLTLAAVALAGLGTAFAMNAGGIRTQVMSVLGPAITQIVGFFQQARDWVVANWPQIRATAAAVFTGIWEAAKPVVTFIVAEFAKVVAWFRENWPLIQRTVMTVITTIQELWRAHGAQIMAVIRPLWEVVKAVIGGALKVILDVVKFTMQVITGDFKGANETLVRIARTIWDTIVAVVVNGVKAVGAAIMGLGALILDAGKRLLIANIAVGKSIIDGLVNGMKASAAAVVQAIVAIVMGAINTVKSLLRIASPSKVTEEMGENVGQGLAGGILRSIPRVREAASSMAASAGQALDAGMQEAVSRVAAMNATRFQNFTAMMASQFKSFATDPMVDKWAASQNAVSVRGGAGGYAAMPAAAAAAGGGGGGGNSYATAAAGEGERKRMMSGGSEIELMKQSIGSGRVERMSDIKGTMGSGAGQTIHVNVNNMNQASDMDGLLKTVGAAFSK